MLGHATEILRRTRKPSDIVWNRWFARPLAAVLLAAVAKTRVTPNQLTLLSLLVFAGAMVLMALRIDRWGVFAAIAILQFSYVLDCADGQLARWRNISTPVGAHLDFLMDEIKALLLVAGVSLHLWAGDGRAWWLIEGVIGAAILGTGLALTTFVRRPEYRSATGAAVDLGAGDYGQGFSDRAEIKNTATTRGPRAIIEAAGRLAIHYPSHILLFALAGRMDWFFHIYLLANAGHAARTLLAVVLRLGRPGERPAAD